LPPREWGNIEGSAVKHCRFLNFIFVLLASATMTLGTGFDDPGRWLSYGEKKALQAPEFFFELELKRLAAELHPGFKSMLPEKENEEPSYGVQTTKADLADFLAALEKGEVKPPDREQATELHKAARTIIDNIPLTDAEGTDEVSDTPSAKPRRTPPSTEPAPAMGVEEFRSEFADYHQGAWAYRTGHPVESATAWKALLARPAAERHYRTTWAAYMLGCQARDEEKWDEARVAFQQVRKAVKEGFADSLGLAAASLGWEAQVEQDAGNPERAAQLFLEQLATGDISAVWSLKYLLVEALEKEPDLGKLARLPTLQRVVTCFAIAGMGTFASWEEATEEDSPVRWLVAIEKIDAKNVKDADRIAWLAYRHGRFDQAARWLRRADANGPYAQWLHAKFALREGKIEAAAKLLSQALPRIFAAKKLDTRGLNGDELLPGDSARGDLGALQIARGDYLMALRIFIDGGHVWDVSYLTEGVLTIPELKKFVDELPPKDPGNEAESDPREPLRHTLASRLIRQERYAEARPYLPEYEHETLDAFTALLERAARKDATKAEKAAALVEAARLIKEKEPGHFELSDVEILASRLTGKEGHDDSYPQTTVSLGAKAEFVPAVTKDERERLRKHVRPPFRNRMYLYVASDLAWRAAALMPDGSEETARLLNTAGNWLKYKDDGAADRFLQAIERRCAKTETGKAVGKKHWFVDDPKEP
jgi:hypothetical protein